MKVSAYVISYFGPNSERRKAAHAKQLDWLHQYNIPIVVLAQGYDEKNFDSRCDYRISEPLGFPGRARNVLLREFYQSDVDLGIFMDSDSVLADRCDGSILINLLQELGADSLKEVHLFVPVDPRQQPFTKDHEDRESVYAKYLHFHRHLGINTSVFFLQNLNKLGLGEIYFDEEFPGPCDDAEYAMQVAYAGLGVYRCSNIVLKEMENATTSLVLDGTRQEAHRREKCRLVDKWRKHGVQFDDDGLTLNRTNFLKTYFVPSDVYVPKPGVTEEFNDYLF